MRARILSLHRNIVTYFGGRTYASKPSRCDAHMNELPVPCGPWDPWYKAKQSWYNKWLLGGFLWWCFSFIMMLWTGSLFLNWGPPLNPAPPSEMLEECDDADTP